MSYHQIIFKSYKHKFCLSVSLFLKTKESERELIRSILSQIADFLKADDTERARKLRQSGTSGNEMAQIFEQLANSEVSQLSMQIKKNHDLKSNVI